MACSSCGKKTTISNKGRTMSGSPTPTKKRVMNGHGSPFGSPKVRMSFGNRNR